MIKKNAFTLQEALITIGIIGIIAAITVPAITKIIPNQYQTKYLKAYASISSLTKDMLMDSNLYWYGSENIHGVPCDGLLCSTVPTPGSVPNELIRLITNNGQNNNPTWVQKYAAILAYNMHVMDRSLFRSPIFIITSDGTIWMFEQHPQNSQEIIVILDVDPNANPAVDAIDSNGNIPTVYYMIINSDGNVTPGDPYGRTYLDDPNRIHNKKDIVQIARGGNDGAPAFDTKHYNDNLNIIKNNQNHDRSDQNNDRSEANRINGN